MVFTRVTVSVGVNVQLSVALAVANHVAIFASKVGLPHSNTGCAVGQVITGAVQSLTTTLKLQLAVCPFAAVMV